MYIRYLNVHYALRLFPTFLEKYDCFQPFLPRLLATLGSLSKRRFFQHGRLPEVNRAVIDGE